MTDARLREAERRWRESGSVDDEARLLLERVRAGELTVDRLELAAYAGHAAARRALGDDGLARLVAVQRQAAEAVGEQDPLLALCAGLHAWGREPVVRCALAALEALVPVARQDLGAGPDDVEVLRGWLRGEPHRPASVPFSFVGAPGPNARLIVREGMDDASAAQLIVLVIRSAAATLGSMRLRRELAAAVGGWALA